MIIALKVFLYFSLFTIGLGALFLAPWVPTRRADFKRLAKLLELDKTKKLYELGCGDGRFLFYAANNYKVRGVGLEIAFPVYLFAKIKSLFFKGQVQIKFKNFLNEDLSSADVVYLFGGEGVLAKKLRLKLEKELKAGAIVASYSFPIKTWTPFVVSKPSDKDLSIYIYKI